MAKDSGSRCRAESDRKHTDCGRVRQDVATHTSPTPNLRPIPNLSFGFWPPAEAAAPEPEPSAPPSSAESETGEADIMPGIPVGSQRRASGHVSVSTLLPSLPLCHCPDSECPFQLPSTLSS